MTQNKKETNNHDIAVQVCRLRRLQRMDLLQKRKLGHYQWRQWKSSIIKCRHMQDKKKQELNTNQHRITRASIARSHDIKCIIKRDDTLIRDALRHKLSRSLLNNEQLKHLRKKDADRHRTARDHLSPESKQQILQKDAFRHKLEYLSTYPIHEEILNKNVNTALLYHKRVCKPGLCTAKCNYREIFKYADKDERNKIFEAKPNCRFKYNYRSIAKDPKFTNLI